MYRREREEARHCLLVDRDRPEVPEERGDDDAFVGVVWDHYMRAQVQIQA
jgi:hypothetical protein